MITGENLMARLGLDTAGFRAGLKEANGAFKAFGGSLGSILSTAGLAAASKEIIDYGAHVFDLAKRYGVTTDAIQKFGNAAAENGSSLEGMAKGFNKLEIAQSRALGGNQETIKAFANLGVTIADLQSMTPEEIMLKLGKSSMNAADMVKVLGKSALELRPTLAGLADGTIELGDAIDSAMIAKLKEADKFWGATWRKIRVVAADALGGIIGEVKFLTTSVTGMWDAMTRLIVADFATIKAAAKGDVGGVLDQLAAAKKALGDFKEAAFGDPGKNKPGAPTAIPRTFEPTGDGTKPKSNASELAAEKKERERDQLSLKELQSEGPKNFSANATAQMMYASQQARLVEQLEAQAKQVRLTGISATGETSAGLLGRADAIRQTLPIKESEKEVGIYRTAFKDALGETNEKLDAIEAQLE